MAILLVLIVYVLIIAAFYIIKQAATVNYRISVGAKHITIIIHCIKIATAIVLLICTGFIIAAAAPIINNLLTHIIFNHFS